MITGGLVFLLYPPSPGVEQYSYGTVALVRTVGSLPEIGLWVLRVDHVEVLTTNCTP